MAGAQPTGTQQPPDTVYVSFSAEINPLTTETLLKACCELSTKGVKTIYLLISTLGGSVFHGINLYNVLRALPCKIVTHNVGAVDSIGTVLFLAGEERYANPGATFMFHGVGFNVQNMRLEERTLRERLDSLLADQRKIADIIRDRTSFPNPKEVGELFFQAAVKDTEFAKDRGIIHEVRQAQVPPGSPIIQLVFQR